MPLYLYDCASCEQQFEVRHSYGSKDVTCTLCGSEDIKRNLSNSFTVAKKNNFNKSKVGDEVIKAIEEGKQDLDSYKKKRKKRVHKEK